MNSELFKTDNILSRLSDSASRGVNDGQVEQVFCSIREVTPLLRRCRDAQGGSVVSRSDDIDGAQMIESDILSSLTRCGRMLSSISTDIDICRRSNVLECNVNITSNISNAKNAMSTSMSVSKNCNFGLWTNNERRFVELRRKVGESQMREEKMPYSDKVNLTGYQTYPEASDLSKCLKLEKSDFSTLQTAERNRLAEKLKVARGSMCRFTRLVIGFLYYIALETRGETDVRVDESSEDRDKLLDYSSLSLVEAINEPDAAFVHCDRPLDRGYINFLLLIAKEYPSRTRGGQQFFERKSRDGEEEVFIPSSLIIGREAPSVVVMCDDKPVNIGGTNPIVYTPGLWFSYMVNYAKSVQLEGDLDLAYSVACVMCFQDNIPSLSLPMRKSQGELFTRSLASKNVEAVVPNNFSVKEALLGAFSLSHAIACVGKDIVSNNLVATGTNRSNRSIFSEFRKSKHTRKRWYRYMSSQGCGDAMVAAELLDCLKLDDSQMGVRLMSRLNPLASWVLSPIESNLMIRYGFTELYRSFQFDSTPRVNHMPQSTKDRSCSAMRLLGVCNGTLKKARNRPGILQYKNDEMIDLVTRLAAGDSCITKGGVCAANSRARYIGHNPAHRVLPQPEVFDNGDDDDDASDYSDEDFDSVCSDEVTVFPCCYSVDEYDCNSTSDNNIPDIPERRRVTALISSPIDDEIIGSVVSGSRNSSARLSKGSAMSVGSSIGSARVLPSMEELLSDIGGAQVEKVPSILATGVTNGKPSPSTSRMGKFLQTSSHKIQDTKSGIIASGGDDIDKQVITPREGANTSVYDDWDGVYDDDGFKKLGESDSIAEVSVRTEYSENVKFDPNEVIDKYNEKQSGREIADPTIDGIAGDTVKTHMEAIIQQCDKIGCGSENAKRYMEKIKDDMISGVISQLDVSTRETLARSSFEGTGGNMSRENTQILVAATAVKTMMLDAATKETDDLLTKKTLQSSTAKRRKEFTRLTKLFTRKLKDVVKEENMHNSYDLILCEAENLLRDKDFVDTSIVGTVNVSRSLLRYAGLSEPTMNEACYGIIVEHFLKASANSVWWVNTSKAIGVDADVCRKCLNCSKVRRMLCSGHQHPGMLRNNKIRESATSICMYVDVLIGFGYPLAVKYYCRESKRFVNDNLRTMSLPSLKAWYTQQPKDSDYSHTGPQLNKDIMDISKLVATFNNRRHINRREQYHG